MTYFYYSAYTNLWNLNNSYRNDIVCEFNEHKIEKLRVSEKNDYIFVIYSENMGEYIDTFLNVKLTLQFWTKPNIVLINSPCCVYLDSVY